MLSGNGVKTVRCSYDKLQEALRPTMLCGSGPGPCGAAMPPTVLPLCPCVSCVPFVIKMFCLHLEEAMLRISILFQTPAPDTMSMKEHFCFCFLCLPVNPSTKRNVQTLLIYCVFGNNTTCLHQCKNKVKICIIQLYFCHFRVG